MEPRPYISPSCKIFFHNRKPFTVPRDFLKDSDALLASCDAFNNLDLRKIPDDAGHVLVHYLYTNTWQTLRETTFGDSIPVMKSHFEISVHVYCAARAYDLPGLVSLAKAKMKTLAFHLPELDVVVSASAACQLLPDDDEWFEVFLHRHVKEMFRRQISLDQSAFMESFQGGTSYSKMLAKSMFTLCCENSGRHRTFQGDNGASVVWEVLDKTIGNESETVNGVQEAHNLLSESQPEPTHEEAPVFETPPLDDWAVAGKIAEPEDAPRESAEAGVDYTVNYFSASPPETAPIQEANPTSLPAKKSKKEKKKDKKIKAAKKNEGVLKGSSVESLPVSERIPDPGLGSEIEPVALEETCGQRSDESGDREAAEPLILESEGMGDPWAFPIKAKKKEKKSGGVAAISPEPMEFTRIWPPIEKKNEKQLWGDLITGNPKVSMESEPEPGPEPEPEPDSTSTIVEDPWEQFSLTMKEKKRLKKLKKESQLGCV
ncbi:hypothetical protein CKAH01_17106 [Colletotrichum kahawae]|uniref:BTB domain-containing protein n=1 Tax=Colletotrichum kahawae TaxID=34407 RepID=A0AAD9YDY1_COLKA|nr:hypothetical protein CKAH01_17106 [Colletotrichum kahawae]